MPPDNIKNFSTAAITKVLRFPGKSLDYDSAHSMDSLGGLPKVQLDKYLMSCITRAGHKTIKWFSQQANELLWVSTDNKLLSDVDPCDSLGRSTTPQGWDSNAFCYKLLCATNNLSINAISNSLDNSSQRSPSHLL